MLKEYAHTLKLNIRADREPGGTSHGEIERRSLQDPEWIARVNQAYEDIAQPLDQTEQLSSESELFGYLKSRAQFFAIKVKPFIEQGGIYLFDRSGDSTVAYQGFGLYKGDLDIVKLILQNNKLAMKGIPIHRTWLLDIPVSEMRARQHKGEFGKTEDRIEQRDDSFFERARHGYLWLAHQNPERFMIIDGTLPPHKIAERIRTDFIEILREHGFTQ